MGQEGQRRPTFAAAAKDAAGTALLALGLCIPILAYRTHQDMSNRLVLEERWQYVVFAVLAAFAARLAYLLAPTI
jgi:branched-chain amino acid transport system permease protein